MRTTQQSQQPRPKNRMRGSAMGLIIIIATVLTGLVMTIAWAAAVQTQVTNATTRVDQAYYVAEAGGQWATWEFKQSNTWRQATAPSTLPTMTIGNNTYKYAVTCVSAGAAATLYWPFDEDFGTTTADVSGHNNTGTLIGGVSWTSAGRYNSALVFDGVSGYVDAGNGASTNIVGDVTMAAWVKMNSAAQDQKVGGNQDGVSGGYKMSIYNTKVEFETRDANNTPWLNRAVSGGTVMTMGNWYHVAGVFSMETNTITTYVNGVLDRQLTGVPSDALTTTTGDFEMGKEPWDSGGATRYFNGTIDDVRVYNRALSAQEIKTLADTSVKITSTATYNSTDSNIAASSNTLNFIVSVPQPLPPVAPALTVGGNATFKAVSVTGNVQIAGNVTGTSASTVNGSLSYGGTYSDSHNYITIQMSPNTASYSSSIACPTINYANMVSLAQATYSSGSGQTYSFSYTPGQPPIIYVNGNCTDPNIDTSSAGGVLLINGNLTLDASQTYGANGFPAYIVVEGNVNQTGGSLNLTGGLYVKGNWKRQDCVMNGDVVVTGNITDNSANGTTTSFIVGTIPWFDPRSSAAPTVLPMYYTDYTGVMP